MLSLKPTLIVLVGLCLVWGFVYLISWTNRRSPISDAEQALIDEEIAADALEVEEKTRKLREENERRARELGLS